ncbi:alpha/beta fold hydrolase [Actinoplanes solisilvae]|uniref:alpha/beta fold hydrolase n=1 Tax=Actinoplanes solisilvae TaxID=2486853 RepID=UPI000FD847A1|nr:hypothetical protein [Actinoplanes solisilvae]
MKFMRLARKDGPARAPVVLLLHGFPTSSAQFRTLIPKLVDKYHVIAPGYQYAMYVFDSGAPTGCCLALKAPRRSPR